MENMKSCPWCGYYPTILIQPIIGYNKYHSYVCECIKCRSHAPQGEFSDLWMTEEEAKHAAIEAWNRRAET